MSTIAPKQPPHSLEAEQSVLGGLMLDNRAWYDLSDKLAEDDFYTEQHRLIFHAIGGLMTASRPCDFVTLSEQLRHDGRLEEAGGIAYLGGLAADTPGAANIRAYAEIVRERAILRSLIAAGQDIASLGFEPDGRAHGTLVDLAEQKVFRIRERGERAQSNYFEMPPLITHIEEKLERLKRDPDSFNGIPTGFIDFDKLTTGLHPSDLVIVAGRPGMGKCLAYDTELVADDGSLKTIQSLYRERSGTVATLRPDWTFGHTQPSDYVDDGCKPVFEVRTRLGRLVEATLPHPFLTLEGWKPLAQLAVGDYIAVPRALPRFGTASMRDCEVRLLAYLIGDGGLTGTSPCFTTTNPTIERDFAAAVCDFGGCRLRRRGSDARAPSFAVVADHEAVVASRAQFASSLQTAMLRSGCSARALASAVGVVPATVSYWTQGRNLPDDGTLRRVCAELRVESDALLADGSTAARHNGPNPLTLWLRELGLAGKSAAGKTVPADVFRLPQDQLAVFLNRLFATDGWAGTYATGQSQIGYSTISERLARQVQHLLVRFGIVAKLRHRWVRYDEAMRPSWQLDITDARSLREFIARIGIFGKQAAVDRVSEALARRRAHHNSDVLPVAIWTLLARAKGEMSWAELASRAGISSSNLHVHRRGLGRERLARFAMALDNAELAALARAEVYWDRIEDITPLGPKQVYDLTIADTHNFVANDICVHNTSFAMNVAEHVAIENKQPVAVFSMEMSAEQLAMRVLSSFGRIDQQRLRKGELDDTDWSRLASAGGLLREAPLYIDETGSLSPLDLRARARRIAARHGIKLIVVDYIQLMQVPSTRDNRTNEISEISRSLKALAKELSVPVIAISQLSRGVESRDNKRPRMSDLRESGGIEQDADVVAFVYRDEYYTKEQCTEPGVAEIIIAKQRNGPTGTVKTAFLGPYTRFDNLAHQRSDSEYGYG